MEQNPPPARQSSVRSPDVVDPVELVVGIIPPGLRPGLLAASFGESLSQAAEPIDERKRH